jgi:hypothetical protein
MKMKKLNLAMMAVSAMASMVSLAHADDISLGMPGYGGTGCPEGTVSATLSPDSKTLSLIFDQYVAEAGGTTGRRMDRKNCQIAIPVHVPQGYSFSIIDMDYRGYNSLPAGANSQFNVEYFLAYPGSPARGTRYSRSFTGPIDQDYLVQNQLGVEAVVWSPCGTDVNLRTSTSMVAQSNRRGDQAMATVDSIDAKAGVIYSLQWRKCSR